MQAGAVRIASTQQNRRSKRFPHPKCDGSPAPAGYAARSGDATPTRLRRTAIAANTALAARQTTTAATDASEFFRLDHAFHDLLLGELGYRRVQSVVEAARAKLDRTREFMLRAPHRRSRSYLEHVAIVDALKRRDADAAQRAMTRHLDRSMEDIELRAAENPQMFAPAS